MNELDGPPMLDIKDKIEHEVNRYQQDIVDTLCDLISIPTVNPPGKCYRTCVDYLSIKLKKWGFEHSILEVSEKDYPRYSIVGEFGEGDQSILLHGHYDVVPTALSDQFIPDIRTKRLYGRGSSDMKSGLVAILFSLRIIKEMKMDLNGRIYFSFVPDEETGGKKGIQNLLESGSLPLPSLGMIMPEPTSGVIWTANKVHPLNRWLRSQIARKVLHQMPYVPLYLQ